MSECVSISISSSLPVLHSTMKDLPVSIYLPLCHVDSETSYCHYCECETLYNVYMRLLVSGSAVYILMP